MEGWNGKKLLGQRCTNLRSRGSFAKSKSSEDGRSYQKYPEMKKMLHRCMKLQSLQEYFGWDMVWFKDLDSGWIQKRPSESAKFWVGDTANTRYKGPRMHCLGWIHARKGRAFDQGPSLQNLESHVKSLTKGCLSSISHQECLIVDASLVDETCRTWDGESAKCSLEMWEGSLFLAHLRYCNFCLDTCLLARFWRPDLQSLRRGQW